MDPPRGDCVWGVFYDFVEETPELEPDFWTWTGTLGQDLIIDVALVFVSDTDPTSLNRSFQVRVDFAPEGYPVLCEGARPNCFTDAADAWLQIRPVDLEP